MLQLTAIHKSFGSHHVFSIDQLRLENGIYWLKGANGSGKSTLMRLVAGLLPFKGDILLNEEISIKQQPVAYRLLVNHSAAEPIYPSFLNGDELVAFISSVKKGTHRQAEEVKSILGITSYLSNPTGSYSSGMIKKLSLLCAFIGQPALILLDEPFTTLDHASQSALCDLVREKARQGISFIITSHHDIETSDIPFTRIFKLEDQLLHETIHR